jgi:hypothetical protein
MNETIQNTVKKVHVLTKHAHITKTTHTRTHITKQFKTTTVQDTHQIK